MPKITYQEQMRYTYLQILHIKDGEDKCVLGGILK